MQKFYAFKGDENRIFDDWNKCKTYMEGLKGYKYKSFSTREEAEAFLSGVDIYEEHVKNDLACGYVVAYTDGSFEEGVAAYSYGVFIRSPDGREVSLGGRGSDVDFMSARNVAGEILGVIAAAEWSYVNGYRKIRIYHDYAGLSMWYDGSWQARSPVSAFYVAKMKKYRPFVKIEFVKVKGHSNNKYNDLVDEVAKRALFDGVCIKDERSHYFASNGEFFSEMVSFVHVQAAKAEVLRTDSGYRFTLGENVLSFSDYSGECVVCGDYGFLACIAAGFLFERKDGAALSGAIKDFFGASIDQTSCLDGCKTARAVIGSVNVENYAPPLFFALLALSDAIKSILDRERITYDRISSLFTKSGDGFAFNRDGIKGREDIERLYAKFYSLRVPFLSLSLDKANALKTLEEIEKLLRR